MFRNKIGVLEWFHFEDYDHVKRFLDDCEALQIKELRTGISWAEWCSPGGKEWISWLIEELSKKLKVLPCLVYTPMDKGIMPKTSSPPLETSSYAEFVGEILFLFSEKFEYVELWNEPNNRAEWDSRLDPEYKIFSEMVKKAAAVAKQYGKKTVLGGICSADNVFLKLMEINGVLDYIDVVGVHGFPGTWEKNWTDWEEKIQKIRVITQKELWITETGFSTVGGREREQLMYFFEVLRLSVERIYWYGAYDLDRKYRATIEYTLGVYDEHEYNMGCKTAEGKEKMLYNNWVSLTKGIPVSV